MVVLHIGAVVWILDRWLDKPHSASHIYRRTSVSCWNDISLNTLVLIHDADLYGYSFKNGSDTQQSMLPSQPQMCRDTEKTQICCWRVMLMNNC